MNVILLSIGDELILGQTVDTNAAWLSAELARVGIRVCEHITVGDDQHAIAEHFRRAAEKVDAVIATGGLGPTDDDLTRHGLAEVLGTALELNADVLEKLKAFFVRIGHPMADTNRIQAMVPRGATVLPNPVGTACGLLGRLGSTDIFVMPGVPREMKQMFAEQVLPRLRERGGAQGALLTRCLHTYGEGESTVAQRLGDLMTRARNPVVNCTVSGGVVSLRINAHAETVAAAAAMISPVEQALRKRLGDLIYGADDQTLPEVVGRLLTERKQTVSVAESCTGGWISKLLTDIPGSSQYYLNGWVVYSNQGKTDFLGVEPELIGRYGVVSEPVVAALAESARSKSGADIGIAVSGIAGPTGGTEQKPVGMVCLALTNSPQTHTHCLTFPGDRERVRLRASLTALNLLRLKLLNGWES